MIELFGLGWNCPRSGDARQARDIVETGVKAQHTPNTVTLHGRNMQRIPSG